MSEKEKRADLVAQLNQIVRDMDSHTLDQVVNFASICVYVTRIPRANEIMQAIVDAQDLQTAKILAVQASQALACDAG